MSVSDSKVENGFDVTNTTFETCSDKVRERKAQIGIGRASKLERYEKTKDLSLHFGFLDSASFSERCAVAAALADSYFTKALKLYQVCER